MTSNDTIHALEFFAGIGGFSAAISDRDDIDVVRAFEISPHCVQVFRQTYDAEVQQADLLSDVAIPDADLWWISAPCTPFTRRGPKRDLGDHRAEPLVAMYERIRERRPRWIVMENVEGFVDSDAHVEWKDVTSDYHVWEDVVCPTDIGVPNKRPRFYSVACTEPFDPPSFVTSESYRLNEILEMEPGPFVSDRVYEKYGRVMHAVGAEDDYTTCFTGSYGKSWVYAGSYIATDTVPRMFSPEQIARALGYDSFVWPETFTQRQKYKYLGNSLSLPVIRAVLSCVKTSSEATR